MYFQEGSLSYYFIKWLISALAVLITAKIIPGIRVASFGSAMIAAIMIGIVNAVLWPVLIFLTLPINILTFGLFTFVINGAVLKIAASLISGFQVNGWISAIFGSIILSIVQAGLRLLVSN